MGIQKTSNSKNNFRKFISKKLFIIRKKEKLRKQFITATKRIKYLGINLLKETEVLYIENCKTLMKEIKDRTNRW